MNHVEQWTSVINRERKRGTKCVWGKQSHLELGMCNGHVLCFTHSSNVESRILSLIGHSLDGGAISIPGPCESHDCSRKVGKKMERWRGEKKSN